MTLHTLSAPVVIEWGSPDPAAPLVVLFHGRGADETSMMSVRDHLPASVRYAAVRAPLPEGDGFAWFANRGIGRPVEVSLAETMAWFEAWLDQRTTAGQLVSLLGFSGGAAFAGGLLLKDPTRYSAGVLLYGTLPFDAGVPLTQGRLAGLPVFLAHGVRDVVIPPELQQRTWDYLVRCSGSPLWALRQDTGHELTLSTVREIGNWLEERLHFVLTDPAPASSDVASVVWPTLPGGELSPRSGPPPAVSVATPQQQESQNAPGHLQEALYQRVGLLDEVQASPSRISVPGARAFTLPPQAANGPADAFIVPAFGEFAHLHPEYDGSLHLTLPTPLAIDALEKGWAASHPLAGIRLSTGMVMVFGPRTEDELETVAGIVAASHAYATGRSR